MENKKAPKKNRAKKTDVKLNRQRSSGRYFCTAPCRQRASILAAVLVSWCAIALGPKTAQAQSPPPYPIGVWGAYGVGKDIDPGLVANLGIVGVGISEDWNVVNPAPGVYDWSTLDAMIAEAKAAGFQYIALAVTDSSQNTPQWVLDALPADQKIALLDPSPVHNTFCEPIQTALYWNPVFHQARLALIAAMGAKYSSDPAIVAVNMAAFANHNSNDWNIQDTVGTIQCPSCPQLPPRQCGDVTVDQVQQWLDAGWTEALMLQVGKEMCDAAAAAFPNQNIKLPIGGLTDNRMSTPDGNPANGNYTQLCRDIENYVYGNADLGIPPRPYANRFYMQRNTVDANWGDGTQYDTFTPGFDSERYIKYMIRKHHPQSGLQMVASATLAPSQACRQGGGANGPCGTTCDPVCVMQASLDVARTYGTTFIEIWPQDSANPVFYDVIRAATIAMGGTPRLAATPSSQLGNISTRAFVQTGDNAMIGGLIVTGSGQKRVIVRAIGPSLVNQGIANPLQNPTLELHDGAGALIASNDNWMDAPNRQEIIDSSLAPSSNLEAAILTSLNPGNYTAIVHGVNNETGIALVDCYDLDSSATSKLANISTRSLVQTGDNVMIGGFIVTGSGQKRVIVRAIGPSLVPSGITNPLLDPTLELHNGNGALIAFDDNWRDSQQTEIEATGLAPTDDRESAILSTLSAGDYTAIVRGKNNTIGVALVEVYDLD